MSGYLVERLRAAPTLLCNVGENAERLMLEAADEIERLNVSLSLAGLGDECPVCGSRIGSCDLGMPPCPVADARRPTSVRVLKDEPPSPNENSPQP